MGAGTYFDWHAGAVEAEGEEAPLSSQSLVTNGKLQQQEPHSLTAGVEDRSTETGQTSTRLEDSTRVLVSSTVCQCWTVGGGE